MNSKQRIEDYLEDYTDLWNVFEGDISVEIIDDITSNKTGGYYGWNLTGKYRMIMLFYTGQSNYFPGIWIGQQNHDNDLEKCPIYICDIASDDEPKYMGNFKSYMKLDLDRLSLEITNIENFDNLYEYNHTFEGYCYEEFCNLLKGAIVDLNNFSDEILDYNETFTCDKVIIDG